jgi:ribosomal protein S18 acetylase RimI-like enzyme
MTAPTDDWQDGVPPGADDPESRSEPGPERPGYQLKSGSPRDRATLIRVMKQTYGELYPDHNFDHLSRTVDDYLSANTPLWWIDVAGKSTTNPADRVGCLWMGTGIDQVLGLRHAHIFLLHIASNHRRNGLGRWLIHTAETWAKGRGDRQISLQVFSHNEPALNLYGQLGYKPQSLALIKPLGDAPQTPKPTRSP